MNRYIALFLRHKLLIIFGAVYILVSAYALAAIVQNSRLGDRYYRATFYGMYNGTAWRPFVYRMLMPRLDRVITDLTPVSIQQGVNDAVSTYLQDSSHRKLYLLVPAVKDIFPDRDSIYPRIVMILLMYGCLWGLIIMMYKLGKELFPGDNAIKYFAPIPALLLIPCMHWKMTYVYDPAVLFLSAACYYFMVTRQFSLYIATFAFACINKESSIFILLFFMLWFYKRLPAKKFILLIASQIIIYATIRMVILATYSHNIGGVFEEYLGRMVYFELYPRNMFHRLTTFALIMFLLVHDWTKKPLFLKYVFLIWPLFFVAYFIYGYPGEYRVFHDIFPLILLLATHTLVASTGISKSPIFNPPKEKTGL